MTYDNIDTRVDACMLQFTLEAGLICPVQHYIVAAV